jgi:apolipoprotein N-acyltransferase
MMLRLFLSAFSGILFTLSLPNDFFLQGNPWIGIFCLSPLFLAFFLSNSLKEAVLSSLTFGGVFTLLSNYWLAFFKDYAYLTLGSVTIAYCGVYALWGVFFWRFSRPGPYGPLQMAGIWCLFEFFKSIGYLGYPWGLIVYPFNNLLPLLQIADLGGIWPLSFWGALGNATIAELLLRSKNRIRYGLAFLGMSIIFLGYGAIRMSTPIPKRDRLGTILVQHNRDPWETGKETENLRTLQRLTHEGIEQLGGKVDLVVWSESSLPRPFLENRQHYQRIPPEEPFLEFLKKANTYFLIGNPVVKNKERWEVQNGVILLTPAGSVVDTYGKRHPVPFAEHIPFYEYPLVQNFFRQVIGLEGIWSLGDTDTIFKVQGRAGSEIRFGVPICFEDAFPYICRKFIQQGSDLLINITNDAWSRRKSAEVQHFVVARFRSIEMKRVLLRATNGGVTGVIGPFGEILSQAPLFEETYLALEVPIFKENHLTFYTQIGDWFPVLLGILLVGVLIKSLIRGETEFSL